MKDFGAEGDYGRFEGIVTGKVDAEFESTALEGRVIGAKHDCFPDKHVVRIDRSRCAVDGRVFLELREFGL